ncbi:MAG: cell division protein FtsL [Lachnospiraceae bacterium]|nr:cell division protein FtsL [Lachnospiraceae bacterium]
MPSSKTNIRKTSTGKATYVAGSAARNLYVLPEQPQRAYPEHSPEKKTRNRKNPTVRRETKTLPVSGISVLILTAATILTLLICVQYVQLQSEITFRLKKINSLETQLNDLTILNNEADKRINCYVDLEHIYQVATEELGMGYADAEQIALYTNSGAEYVRQYENIPD